jgi:two-component system chemotaxis sensor kinase CheA
VPVAAQSIEPPVSAGDEVALRPPLPDNGKRVYDIQFVPTEISAKGEGVANLLDELRTMGSLEIIVHPDGDSSSGFWELRLVTDVAQEVFSDQIDFVSDSGVWRINEDTSVAVDGTTASVFGESPVCRTMFVTRFLVRMRPTRNRWPTEEDGYGSSNHSSDLVRAKPPWLRRRWLYFSPVASCRASSAPDAVPMAEKGDGFGFFCRRRSLPRRLLPWQ